MDYRRQKDASSPRRAVAPGRQVAMTKAIEKKTPPLPLAAPTVSPTGRTMERMPSLDFLLSHSHTTLCELELISLSRSSNALKCAKEQMDEAVAQREVAGVVRWLMENREVLLEAARRTILPAKGGEVFEPDAKLEQALTRAREEIRDQGRSQEETGGPMPSPWLVRQRTYFTDEQRRAGRSAIEKRCREKHIAAGKCERCSEPLDPNSVRECSKHLAAHRQRDAKDRQKKGIKPGTQGRQPGTLRPSRKQTRSG